MYNKNMERPNKDDYDFNDVFEAVRFAIIGNLIIIIPIGGLIVVFEFSKQWIKEY